MVFSSTLFIFMFLPITLLGYFLIPGKLKNYWLLFVSLIFFAWSQPNYLWIILLNVVINYFAAMGIHYKKKYKKPILALAIIANLAILFYFKYIDMAITSINKITGLNLSLLNVVLPIGISFFTFQGMSYTIDVYRDQVPVQKNIFKVALYIMLFPQLIAGPIVRYTDIAEEIDKRSVSLDDFTAGIERFIIGLGKKAIIANTLAETVDTIWGNGAASNVWYIAWLGSICYTLQIFFDFSGYSDMAIGLGRMFGFHFCENFNLPYISKSITEFWRRWHISLSSWFRDYVYIPLGGNRKHVYLNLAIVFLLTGIWHGASYHYVVWGVWNGAFMLIERRLGVGKKSKLSSTKESEPPRIGRTIVSKIYTLFVVNLGWVIFRAPSTKEAVQYIATMFGILLPESSYFTIFWYLDKWTLTILIAGIICASSIPSKVATRMEKCIPHKCYICCKYILLIGLLYLSMLRVVSGTYNPFIYFQF